MAADGSLARFTPNKRMNATRDPLFAIERDRTGERVMSGVMPQVPGWDSTL